MDFCIFGAASPETPEKYTEPVRRFAKKMAQRGHDLVFGGGADGVMGASAIGTQQGGGKVTGVIPTFFKMDNIEPPYDKCDHLYHTNGMAERKAKMEQLAEAFIIAPGGIGTYEEFYEVLVLKELGRHNLPIVLFNVDGFYDPMIKALEHAKKEGFLRKDCLELFAVLSDPDEIIDYVENYSAGNEEYVVSPYTK